METKSTSANISLSSGYINVSELLHPWDNLVNT